MRCKCCESCLRQPGEVIAWWTGANGYPYPLCEMCLAIWLRNAADDLDLTPRKIDFLPVQK